MGDKAVFDRMTGEPDFQVDVPKTVMLDAVYLKAHRMATSLRSKKEGRATKRAA